MPDAVSQLMEQHNRLRRLFKQIPGLGGHQEGEARAVALWETYTVHSRLEEDVVYPVLRQVEPGLVDEDETSHTEAEKLLDDLRQQEYANNTEVKRDLDKLQQVFEAHAAWSESKVMPRLSSLSDEEAAELGRAVFERNQELLREHPRSLETSAETEGFIASPRI